MPEDEETPSTPGWLGEGILQNGVDQGAGRRTVIREANARRQHQEADRVAQRSQDRAERPQRATVPGKPAPPLRGRRTPGAVHPVGLGRVLAALTIQGKAEGMQPEAEVTY